MTDQRGRSHLLSTFRKPQSSSHYRRGTLIVEVRLSKSRLRYLCGQTTQINCADPDQRTLKPNLSGSLTLTLYDTACKRNQERRVYD